MWSRRRLKPVAPPHASQGLSSPRQGGASRRQAEPSEAYPLRSFELRRVPSTHSSTVSKPVAFCVGG
jgi:hypothetical protein